jgi:aminoglycoside 3-N-acetyltransferase
MTIGKRVSTALAWRFNYAKDRLSRQSKRIRRRLVRLDSNDLLEAFESLDAHSFNILFVHSSLAACGKIQGGPRTVVSALAKSIGERTLAMPTHTYCYPDEKGNVPVYKPDESASQVGAITDYFWRQPAVVRSNHPTHSIASAGPESHPICEGHESCETPCGSRTPYERMIQKGTGVLMFGAKMDSYTLFHTAEDVAGAPYLYESQPYDLLVADPDGTIRSVRIWRQDNRVRRRFREMDGWLERRGLLQRRKLGCGEMLFIPSAQDVHEVVIEEILKDPLFLVATLSRRSGAQPRFTAIPELRDHNETT